MSHTMHDVVFARREHCLCMWNSMGWLSLLVAAPAGLEYDLDLFNVVAVSDFNMGAMENK